MESDLETVAASVGALEDEARRRMYLFIREQGRPVSQDEAAKEAGISRKLAAFHLDKLVDRGLLKAHYARPAGKTGPGAGRPAKLYEPSGVEMGVSIPERRYDLVGSIVVEALESRSAESRRPRPPDGSRERPARRWAVRSGEPAGSAPRARNGLCRWRETCFTSTASSPMKARQESWR